MKSFFIDLNQIENLSFEYNAKSFTFSLPVFYELPSLMQGTSSELVDLHIGKGFLSDKSFTIYESCFVKKKSIKGNFVDFLVHYKKIRSSYTADIRSYLIDELLAELS